ncbi:MAG: hypothetical protein H8E40_13325 [Chloroflexi bacterium]|nr:hypothetical protein [Chloroflexota bacterium]
MISMGCGIGTLAIKIVIVEDGTIVTYDITPTEGRVSQAIEKWANKVLSNAVLSIDDINSTNRLEQLGF